jgi:hypothetical protein
MIGGVSLWLGQWRTMVRRIGGLALLFIGVHMGAYWLDQVIYDLIDQLDLWADDAMAAGLAWLALHGGLSADGAVKAIEHAGSAIDLEQKEWLAVRCALAVELLLDIALFAVAWGARGDAGATWTDDFRTSATDVWAAMKRFDLERWLAPPALLLLSVIGALTSATALEPAVRNGLAQLPIAAITVWHGPMAAAGSVLLAALLVWRFLPDMLQGAWRRAARRDQEAKLPPKPSGARAVATWIGMHVRAAVRGWWWLFPLWLSVDVMQNNNTQQLLQRLQPPDIAHEVSP